MKKCILLVLALFPLTASANSLFEAVVDGHKIKALKVIKDTGYKIIVGVSQKGESLESMVSRYGGVSGVNGAYFCPADYKSQCPNGNVSYADRISNSYDWSYSKDDTGPERTIFAFDVNQNPFLYRKAHDYSRGRDDEFLVGKTLNFDRRKDIYNGIGNHPLLLQDGVSKIWESGAIDAKMKSKSLKNFICSNKEGTITFMGGVESVTIYEVPEIIKKIGCHNAVNLDGGGSTAMIHNNKYVKGPGRNIMDAWIVIPDKNYPGKIAVNESPVTKRASSKLMKLVEAKFANLDDFTRKQKYFALSAKLGQLADSLPTDSPKRKLLEGLKDEVDRSIQ